MARKRGKRLQDAIDDALNELASPRHLKRFGKFLELTVVKRTRLGKGVDKPKGRPKKLKKLSESYKDQRSNKTRFFTSPDGVIYPIERKKFMKKKRFDTVFSRYLKDQFASRGRHPDLDPTTNPSKSNVTFTGELLRSITNRISRGFIVIEPSGIREDGLTNKDLSDDLEEQGRSFLNVSKAEVLQLTQRMRDKLERLINKRLTKIK